ncbi:MAG: hypothetical protein ACRDNK_11265, partial [Solirubrobacteraceae bacterium]
LMACHDPEEMLALQVRLSRQLNERAGDLVAALRSAATVEPDMATPYAEGIKRHRSGMRATARRLAELGALRSGVGESDAAALLDVLLAPDSWAGLTTEHGLRWDSCESLLHHSLRLLLRRPSLALRRH